MFNCVRYAGRAQGRFTLTKPRFEVLSRLLTLNEFAVYSSHKADNDFQLGSKAFRIEWDPFTNIKSERVSSGAIVRELSSIMKRGRPQIRHKSDDANVIF